MNGRIGQHLWADSSGLYWIDPPPPAALEGSMEWTTDKLVEVFKESEWWADMHTAFKHEADDDDVRLVRAMLDNDSTERQLRGWSDSERPFGLRLYALEDEIKSGAIYGSPDKCAVCGEGPADDDEWKAAQPKVYLCAEGCSRYAVCTSATIAARDPSDARDAIGRVRRILRARRLLSERTAVREVEAKGSTTKQPGHDRCGLCGGGIYALSDRDVYHCGTCGAEAHGTQVRYSNIVVEWRKPTPAAEGKTCKKDSDGCHTCGRNGPPCRHPDGPLNVKSCRGCDRWEPRGQNIPTPPPPAKVTPKCWKCHRPNIVPAMIITSAPAGKRGDDERPLCYDCMRDNDAWHKEQDRLASVARDELDRPTASEQRRHRQILGLERGDDPRLIGTCGDWPPNRGPR